MGREDVGEHISSRNLFEKKTFSYLTNFTLKVFSESEVDFEKSLEKCSANRIVWYGLETDVYESLQLNSS